MLVKEAKKITGSMTRTKKMPGLSYSLPAWECITGKKLRAVKGSVCAGCYALKGNYTRYPAIKAAQYYRLASLMKPQWTEAMVAQVKRQAWFRWHDAGDLQSGKHLTNIFEVCKQTPSTKQQATSVIIWPDLYSKQNYVKERSERNHRRAKRTKQNAWTGL